MANNLYFLSLADKFSFYPQIFCELVANKEHYDQIYLPSDVDWQDSMYYMLLDVQKKLNEPVENGKNYEDAIHQKETPVFDSSHIERFSTTGGSLNLSNEFQKCVLQKKYKNKKIKILWTLDDICKAAQLLKKPTQYIIFASEHDMRKVFSLLYDVFRYIADVLWTFRTKLAASFSRMRIKYGARKLSKLLPTHLQNEKVARAVVNSVVTGWINPFLIRDKDAAESLLLKYGFVANEEATELLPAQFKWDSVCPLVLSCVPTDRSEFSKSELVMKNYFIIQDRAFSLGPAVMARLLTFFDLNGDILQTHINSPRSTAYLASLFYSVDKINNFYVYGSGSNLKKLCSYMENLCIYNIRLFAESFTSFSLESSRFATVVGIFANPPNSFSAISDPIDLICSRGGDLAMLEMLTESSISNDDKEQVSLILKEQLLTLRMAMSRPQVQFLLYQTHSVVNIENQKMVEYSLNMINKTALKKHRDLFFEKNRLKALQESDTAIISSGTINFASQRKKKNILKNKSHQNKTTENVEVLRDRKKADTASVSEEVKLPEIDEFISGDIPDFCKNQDNCLQNQNNGCFLSLLKRKTITRLNAKYLIQTAEKRGLFGKTEYSEIQKSKSVKS